ncbi:MAG: HEPN domain-containing protein [Chitinophagales bacterium]
MSRAETWLREAQADLETGRVLLAGERYNACAFYAQQAAETSGQGAPVLPARGALGVFGQRAA